MTACFECSAPATCEHHVIPRSLGGTKTVPLCGTCHSRAHGLAGETWANHGTLTSIGQRRARAEGRHTGGDAPYGYRVEDGRLFVDEREMAIIAEAQRLHAAGLSLRKIGAALTSAGMHPRPSQTTWTAKTVSRLAQWSAPAVGRLVKGATGRSVESSA
jgi:hypothetical protein